MRNMRIIVAALAAAPLVTLGLATAAHASTVTANEPIAPVIAPVGIAPVIAPVGIAPVIAPVGIAPVIAPVRHDDRLVTTTPSRLRK